jgi:predicted nuclease of predicted toxin-antitoxin system
MKFKIDENLPVDLAILLRGNGHDAETVYDEELVGASDPDIVARCQAEGRAVVTFDSDFSDIRAYPPDQYRGIVVLRLKRQDRDHVVTTFKRLLPVFETEDVEGRLWIVDEDRIRIRD